MIGRVVLGRYRIVSELARGGMGVVYLARAEGAGGFVKPVVIKLVLPQHAEDARFLGMFVREAQILSDLRHPSIVAVLDFGQEGQAYVMALEYIRGYHLGQWAKYLRKTKRAVPPAAVMLWTIDVLEALHKAHGMTHPDGSSMHIVHRDVSPSNILLDEDGRARLLDFGVARMRGGNVDYQTQVQSFVGKFSYGAPELLNGFDASAQSDLYSCGVVLHELLLGRNAFLGSEDALTLAKVTGHVPELIEGLNPETPQGLDAVLQSALEKDPTRRFQNAWDFAAALRALLPPNEDDLRGRMAAMLKEDFGEAMARMLGVESLAQRDQAWRHVQRTEVPAERTIMLDIDCLVDPSFDDSAPRCTPGDATSSVRPSGRNPVQSPKTTYRGSSTTTGRLSIPKPPLPGTSSATYAAAAPQPSPAARSSVLGWLVPVLVVTCLVFTALYVAFRPVAPAPMATRVIRVVSEPQAEDRKRAAQEEASARARIELLTSIVDAHQERIDVCFARKPRRGEATQDVAVHFRVDASGKVTSANVLPEDLDKTAFGRCLRAVGKGTRFPALGSEQSFTIRLRASP